MDLKLLGSAMWRFKWLVVLGVIAAAGLAVISTVRITTDGKVSYRQGEKWASYSRIFVTQRGFPWGQLAPTSTADSGRFVSLALLYSSFANSDPVKRLMLKMGPPIPGQIESAAVLTSAGSSDALPIISIAGLAATQRDSLQLTARATTALVAYIRGQQAANDIPDDDRVVVQVIEAPGRSTLLAGRSKTVPAMVFLAVLTVVLALVLVLENLRPRVRAVGRAADEPLARPKLSA
jgi:hypothetical protein